MCASLPDIIRRLNTVVIDEIGHTLTGQRIGRRLDLEMDMRFARISGVAYLGQNLTAAHVVPHLYAQTAWLQVQVGSELTSAQIKDDIVTEHGVGRHFYGGCEFSVVPRHIVRKSVPYLHHSGVRPRPALLDDRLGANPAR